MEGDRRGRAAPPGSDPGSFFTIDGAKTKDMDDALAITKLENGWGAAGGHRRPDRLCGRGRAGQEAAQRAFTVYMPGRNVPMIPRTLSDELCSLKGRGRNTLCARLLIAEDGLLLERPSSSPPASIPMPVSAMTTSPTGPSTAKRWISTPASWPSCP